MSNTACRALETGAVSYVELDSILSLEDALNVIEFNQVAEYNKQILRMAADEQQHS